MVRILLGLLALIALGLTTGYYVNTWAGLSIVVLPILGTYLRLKLSRSYDQRTRQQLESLK